MASIYFVSDAIAIPTSFWSHEISTILLSIVLRMENQEYPEYGHVHGYRNASFGQTATLSTTEDLNCDSVSALFCLTSPSAEESTISNLATTLPLSLALRTFVGSTVPLRFIKGTARCNLRITRNNSADRDSSKARLFSGTAATLTCSVDVLEGLAIFASACIIVSCGSPYRVRAVSTNRAHNEVRLNFHV